MKWNPKIVGSGIIDCIPQTGLCPQTCKDCYFNSPGFYLDKGTELPLIPTMDQAKGRVVRMNPGHDSHLQKDLVIKTALQYEHFFFNTSFPDLDFPGPVMVTVNPAAMTDKDYHRLDIKPNLMFVRVRSNLWNLNVIEAVCRYYTPKDVSVGITWMRYNDWRDIPDEFIRFYEHRKHVLNEYWSIFKQKAWEIVLGLQNKYPKVYMCGTHYSSLCKDCGHCLREYFATKERMIIAG